MLNLIFFTLLKLVGIIILLYLLKIEDNPIYGTDAYWRLNDATYN